MNSRERVIKTLNHKEPDRVPLALGGSAYNLHDDVYFDLLEYLDLPNNQESFRFSDKTINDFKTSTYLDERLQKALNVDFRYIYQETPSIIHKEGNYYIDDWGLININKEGFIHTKPNLLNANIEDVKRHSWPNPEKYRLSTDIVEKAKRFHKEGYAVVARSVDSYGFMERAGQLRGTEQFFVDMISDQKFAHCLIDKVGETFYKLNEVYLDTVGKYVDILELPGDDYGAQNAPIISPKMFCQFFKPWLKKLVELVKQYNPNIYVLAHSDGYITPFIKEYIDVGVDIIHPLQPGVGMDFDEIKQKYGNYITFLGTIDIQKALPAGSLTTKEELKNRINQLASGGGFIIAPSNHIGPDVSAETVVEMYNAAIDLGKY